MKTKILIILIYFIPFSLFGQECISIVTFSGKLSTKESLEKYWNVVTKKNLSIRKKVVFNWEDSTYEKSKDSITSYFKIIYIEKYNGESYIKKGNIVKKCKVFVITLLDTVSEDYFSVFISDKSILTNKKIKVGDVVFIKIIPYTEYNQSKTIGDHYNVCITIGNIYFKNFNKRYLTIATSPFFEMK
jgi:hypothetical protein